MNAKAAVHAVVIGSVALALPAASQTRPAVPAGTEQIQAREEISALEAVLENAVRYGALMLDQRLQDSGAPDMVLLTGMARSRGFRLEGYGAFFDVEFPSIRRSVMWGLRAIDRTGGEMAAAMQEMRKNIQSVADPRARQELERALKIFEAQMKPAEAPAAASGNALRAAIAAPAAPAAAPADPRAMYLAEITNALVDALLDHGAPVGVAADEWLTIAAREGVDRRFVPDDRSDTAITLVLRIKGADLTALREHRLSRDETRKRVEIKQY
jgi:hypothetical protein